MFSFTSIWFYIAGIPKVSNSIVTLLPESWDKKIGRGVSKEIILGAPIDKEKTKLLNEFYKELHFNSKTKLYVVKANEFNAFALPDNSIFVFDKVLKDVNSYQELAALLGHEYSHIKYRHSMKGIAQSLSWAVLAELLSGDDKSNNFIRSSGLLLTLKNSREFETQADLGGLELLREQHIDLNGMTNLFQTMLELPEENKSETSSYLSTHPDTEDRLDNVEEVIKAKPSDSKVNSKLELIFDELKANDIQQQ